MVDSSPNLLTGLQLHCGILGNLGRTESILLLVVERTGRLWSSPALRGVATGH